MNCFSEKIVTYRQHSNKRKFSKENLFEKNIFRKPNLHILFVTVGPAKGSNLKNSPAASDI